MSVIVARVSKDFAFGNVNPVDRVKSLSLPIGNPDSGLPKCSGGWEAMDLI